MMWGSEIACVPNRAVADAVRVVDLERSRGGRKHDPASGALTDPIGAIGWERVRQRRG
jgi:hypothetical protein